MPVILDHNAKKALVKTFQSKANKHFTASKENKLTLSQVGEWLAEALDYESHEDLVTAIKTPGRTADAAKVNVGNSEAELNQFARNASSQLISEIEDSALDCQDGWNILLIKFADLCQSIYLVDSPANLKNGDQWAVKESELIAQTVHFFKHLLSPQIQSISDMRGQLSDTDRSRVNGLLNQYRHVVEEHSLCNTMVTCVPDHTNALTIAYRMVVENRLNDSSINSYRSAPVIFSIATEIESFIRSKGVCENPSWEISHAVMTAFEIVAEKIQGRRHLLGRPVYPERHCPGK